MNKQVYAYGAFRIEQDAKGTTVITYPGFLVDRIDSFAIPDKGHTEEDPKLQLAGFLVDGVELWKEFAAAIATANNAFNGEEAPTCPKCMNNLGWLHFNEKHNDTGLILPK